MFCNELLIIGVQYSAWLVNVTSGAHTQELKSGSETVNSSAMTAMSDLKVRRADTLFSAFALWPPEFACCCTFKDSYV